MDHLKHEISEDQTVHCHLISSGSIGHIVSNLHSSVSADTRRRRVLCSNTRTSSRIRTNDFQDRKAKTARPNEYSGIYMDMTMVRMFWSPYWMWCNTFISCEYRYWICSGIMQGRVEGESTCFCRGRNSIDRPEGFFFFFTFPQSKLSTYGYRTHKIAPTSLNPSLYCYKPTL